MRFRPSRILRPSVDAMIAGVAGGLLLAFVDGISILLDAPVTPYTAARLWTLNYVALFYGLLGAIVLGVVALVAETIRELLRRRSDRIPPLALYSGLASGLVFLLYGLNRLSTIKAPFEPMDFVGPSTYWQVDLIRIPQTASPGERAVGWAVLLPLSVVAGIVAGWLGYTWAGRLRKWPFFHRLTSRRKRPILLAVLAVLLLPLLGRTLYQSFLRDLPFLHPSTGRPASQDRPNIVLISIDTLRADYLGAYGYPNAGISPWMDSLAQEGVLFEEATSQAPWTYPSFLSIHTSLYPASLGFTRDNPDAYVLDTARNTLAEMLQQAGYYTQGYVTNAWLRPQSGLDQGYDGYEASRTPFSFDPEYLQEYSSVISVLYQYSSPLYRAFEWGHDQLFDARLTHWSDGGERITPYVRRFLQLHHRDRFFLWIHYIEPHTVYNPSEPFHPLLPGVSTERENWLRVLTEMNALSWALPMLRPDDRAALESLYAGEVADTDACVGKILAALDRWDLMENTVIVIAADHGEEFGDHDGLGHGRTLYRELTRVPLIISGPAVTVPGRRVSLPVQNIDLMPTLLEIAGAPVPPEVEGRSLLPLLQGEDMAPHTIFTEANSRGRSPWELRAIIEGDHKLVYNVDLDRAELYNLRLDPGEQDDLASEQPERASVLLGRLRGWMAYTEEVVRLLARSDEQNSLDESTLRALRNAGY